MITFKIDNRTITYYDPELNEKLAFALLKDRDCEVGGIFNHADSMEKLHKQVDEGWNNPKMSLKTLELMHTYINNLIPIDNFIDFISNNEWFGGFDFECGEFINEVIVS